MPGTTKPWRPSGAKTRRGRTVYWVGNGDQTRFLDPRNWASRPFGQGCAQPPQIGDQVVIDGRLLRDGQRLDVPMEVYAVSTRRVQIEKIDGGVMTVVGGTGPLRNRRLRLRRPRLSWRSPRALAVAVALRARDEVLLARLRFQARHGRPVGPLRTLTVAALVAALLGGEAYRQRGILVPVVGGGATVHALAGGGNWSAAGTWSSGAAPTSQDDVQLLNTSGNVTIDATSFCRSLDCTGYTGTLTHSSGQTLVVGDATAGLGNVALKLVGTMTYTVGSSTTSVIGFVSSSATAQTVACGGKTLGTVFYGSSGSQGPWVGSGSWRFSDTNTASGSVNFSMGALATGSQSCSWGSFTSGQSTSAIANPRAFDPGSSTVSLTGSGTVWSVSQVIVGNFTVAANTAVVNVPASGNFSGGGPTDYNGMSLVLDGATGHTITNAFTIQNVTLVGTTSSAGIAFNPSSGTITIQGNLTVTGSSATVRPTITTSTVGTTALVAVNGTVTATNTDIRDISVSGAANWDLSAQNTGDLGGNSGITFTPATTQTATASASWSWSDATKWTSRVPLPQDKAVVSVTAGTPTITLDMPRLCKDLDCSGTTVAAVLSFASTAVTICGSVTIPAAMGAPTGTNTVTLRGSGSFTINVAKTLPNTWTLDAPTGVYTLSANFTTTVNLNLTRGTLIDNGQTVGVATFATTASNTRTLTLTGTWNLSGTGTIWNVSGTGLTFSASAATINSTSTASATRTFAGGGMTYGTLKYVQNGTGQLSISGSNTFGTLDVETTTAAKTLNLVAATMQTVTTALTIKGVSSSFKLTVQSSSAGTPVYLNTAPGCVVTNTNTTVSGDVRIAAYTAISQAGLVQPNEALHTSRMPRTVTIASPTFDAIPDAYLDPTTGTVVMAVQTGFDSTDTTTHYAFSLDDLSNNNRVQMYWNGTTTPPRWDTRRVLNNAASSNPALADTFANGDRRVLAAGWDSRVMALAVSGLNGGAQLLVANAQVPSGAKSLHLGATSNSGAPAAPWSGTILWAAFFNVRLSDADIAALAATYQNTLPSFIELPAGATLLYRSDWSAYVTTIAESAKSDQIEATTGLAAATSRDPVEAPGGLLTMALDPLEAIGRAAATALDPLEALTALAAATADEPLESTKGLTPSAALYPVEAPGGIAGTAVEPLESIGLASEQAAEPLEATLGISEQRTLPFASGGPPRPGRVTGSTARTGSIEKMETV